MFFLCDLVVTFEIWKLNGSSLFHTPNVLLGAVTLMRCPHEVTIQKSKLQKSALCSTPCVVWKLIPFNVFSNSILQQNGAVPIRLKRWWQLTESCGFWLPGINKIYRVAIYHSLWQSDKILMHFMGDMRSFCIDSVEWLASRVCLGVHSLICSPCFLHSDGVNLLIDKISLSDISHIAHCTHWEEYE